jgi:predicted MPP superfamily phosphohydrolase
VAAALQAALERTGELPPTPRPESTGPESSEPLDLLDTSTAPWLTDPELGVQWAESWIASHPEESEPPPEPEPPAAPEPLRADPPPAEAAPVAQAPEVAEFRPPEPPPAPAPRAPAIQQAHPLPWEAAAVDPLPPRQRSYEPRSLERMLGSPISAPAPPTAYVPPPAVHPEERAPRRDERVDEEPSPSRRGVTFAIMVGLALGMVAGLVAYAVGPAVREVYLTRYLVPVYELPAPLEGLRVVQVSDLHLPGSAESAAVAAALVATSKPDVLLLTGDILDDASPEALAALDRFLATAKGARGTFAVAGEREASIHGPLRTAYEQHDVQLLTNEQATIDVRGARLVISGFEGPVMAHPEIVPVVSRDPSPENLGRRRVKIVMVHAPQLLSELSQSELRDAAFIVAGHTLGGRLGLPSLLGGESRYRSGWYNLEQTELYVSNGVGTGRWRARLFAPAEVTRFTLQRAANAYSTPTKDRAP